MTIHRRAIAGLAIFIATAGLLTVFTAGRALATDPPWEPDGQSLGGIAFYDSTGSVVTGGDDLSHIADYAVASSGPSSGATFATLFFAAPDHTKIPALWTVDQQGSSAFPNGSAPAPIDGFARPVVTLGATDACLACSLGGFVKDATAGYADIYQVRIFDSGPGGAGSNDHYWSADVAVDEGAGTWTQVYPVLQAPNWLPVLSGPHRIGSKEQCLASFDQADSITYAWFQDGNLIAGATGASYTPPENLFGKDLSCRVTASSGGGDTEATSKAFTLGVGPALSPTSKPYLFNGSNRNSVKHGTTETVNKGTWSPDATSFDYQWYAGKSKIKGATSNKYKPSASDVGKKLTCVVTAHRSHWTDGSFKTAGVKVT